jgi:hypothetical protein
MWRGGNPIEDFGRFMSAALSDLLNQQVDRILVDMKDSHVAAATRLLVLKGKNEKKAKLIA